ncbi:1-acyl-sn-glycerol-3-phosphate acyltransferase [Holzapfeliella sp. He02]|uniref:1-acyl-sn-glycerol-3-phosphate acyltransferase n=1 Tax=Holzapfeliella saturejae TaxID=3082953 RepID=A0ABU8SHM3_9LACO
MFYRFIRVVARAIFFIINGRPLVLHKERLPEGNYILIAPHRTWWEPIIFALAASPKEFMFMAKKELFKNPILRFVLNHSHGFSVDRQNPGPSVIKIPVKNLRNTELSLIMFPTGSRYSNDVKAGAGVIAKMANVPLVPAVYQGPLKMSGVFKRQKMSITFGEPIYIDKKQKLTDEFNEQLDQDIQNHWHAIDQETNPNFKYIPKEKK